MTLRAAFQHQAISCEALGSPFTGRLLRLCARNLEPGTPLTDRLFAWEGDISSRGHSVPLRLMGALHAMVLDGTAPELIAVYPPNAVASDAVLWETVQDALSRHAARIDAWIDRPPQTNEVGRSAVLIAVGHWLTERLGLPLVLSELGASAGLNLMWDRFALSALGQTFGPAAPALTLSPEWRSAVAPPAASPQVIDRRGVDLTPLNPRDPDGALRLSCYLWPDQTERLARARAAISVAEAQVDAADAADWLGSRLAEPPPASPACHLIYHTIAWQYFPAEVSARARALIETAGAQATADTPLAWFSMEADDQTPGAAMVLRLWPGDLRFDMGRTDFHGRWVDWQPKEATLEA
ncbi:hypothetical protein AIOL_003136 [Candidatus Rhodobacter oscarellae]|uniref:DUF2332 domain-containing protein n=1 Tax=Candidatus Rhodobacter oscarellae TaxID=1675527 RepID=A0A0J9E5Z2_9RHOB|nr:DUF2332 family protein [Candidatus Rhodobacter lobularis]KMW58165.1 hypothetical protein AIOL_003136 [Candidatus Rhodobacter lobularis]